MPTDRFTSFTDKKTDRFISVHYLTTEVSAIWFSGLVPQNTRHQAESSKLAQILNFS